MTSALHSTSLYDVTTVQDLMDFLENSPTAWHAIDQIKLRLDQAGFIELKEHEKWELEHGNSYYTIRNGSIITFKVPEEKIDEIRCLGTHSDSPGILIKPHEEKEAFNYTLYNAGYYGCPNLDTFRDKDLSLAGRVTYLDQKGQLKTALIHNKSADAIISPLAVHFDRSLKEKVEINAQKHLSAISGLSSENSKPLRERLCVQLKAKKILSHELFLVPLEKPSIIGPEGDLLASGRLDNLLGTHACLKAFTRHTNPLKNRLTMFACWNNEEMGSRTPQGAFSSFLPDVAGRILDKLGNEQKQVIFRRSLLVSNDAAHAIHPNYPEAHEPDHQPQLGNGPVIKYDSQYHYGTNAPTAGLIKKICLENGIPFQEFITRADLNSGATIGPIAGPQMGWETVDLGSGILSMHSSRELCSTIDHTYMCQLMEAILGDTTTLPIESV